MMRENQHQGKKASIVINSEKIIGECGMSRFLEIEN